MGQCNTSIKKVTFDFTDEQMTQVTVQIDYEGDCPHVLRRVYTKAFPARLPAVEIMTMKDGIQSYLVWD